MKSELETMTDAAFFAWQLRPKTCSKCRYPLTNGDFSLTTIRGRTIQRTWCDSCMQSYYREYARRKAAKKLALAGVQQCQA